jgi:hypothetical protein
MLVENEENEKVVIHTIIDFIKSIKTEVISLANKNIKDLIYQETKGLEFLKS